MSCSYVCGSCRQRLIVRSRSVPRQRQASFTSLNNRSAAYINTQIDWEEQDPRPRQRTFELRVPSQYERSVEDDFLERLFESRNPTDLGPYSRGPYSKRREEREKERQRLSEEKKNLERDETRKTYDSDNSTTHNVLSEPQKTPPSVRLKSGIAIPYYRYDKHLPDVPVSDPSINTKHAASTTRNLEAQSLRARSKGSSSSLLNLVDGTSTLRPTIKVRSEKLQLVHNQNDIRNPSPRTGRLRRTLNNPKKVPLFKQGIESLKSPELELGVEELGKYEKTLESQIGDSSLTVEQVFKAYLKLNRDRRVMNSETFSVEVERQLLERITANFSDAAGPARKKPGPLEALSQFKLSQRAYVIIWQETMWSLIAQLIPVLLERVVRPSDNYVNRHIHEIAELWKHFLTRNSHEEIPDKSQRVITRGKHTSWDSLSESEHMAALRGWSTKDFAARFFQFFGKQAQLVLNTVPGVDTVALVSFVVFRRYFRGVSREGSIPSRACAPFMRFMSQLMPYSSVAEELPKHENIIAPYFSEYVDVQQTIEDLREITLNAVSIYAEVEAAVLPVANDNIGSSGEDSRQVRADMFKKRVGRALEDQNVVRIEVLWKEAQTAFNDTMANGEASCIPTSVYSHFLMAFMATRRPNRAIDVWNHMVESNVPVTVGTWDAMMKGCAKAKDPKSLEAMWQKMLQSGVRPDSQAFATRIHGLTTTGYWESGIRVFKGMIHDWLESVKRLYPHNRLPDLASLGDVEGAPKPNTQCLNSLVLGLARGRKHGQLVQVISWARAIGVKVDIYTFNPLFRLALKDGNMGQATRVLQQMSKFGVKPDIASFTMLLESLFREDDTLPEGSATENATSTVHVDADLKHDAAMSIFKEMERAGIEANAWSFSTLINGLLKSPTNTFHPRGHNVTSASGNLRAAHAVLAHMSANSVPLSSQIYTALITYHFSLSPPDLAAIESLWNRARVDRQVFLDVVFFDRLIEGLAGANEIGRMMTALAQAGKRGKVPGWIAMKEVVAALARVGDWDRVEDVVSGVRLEEHGTQDEVRARKGKKDFWDLVESMGLEGPRAFESRPEQEQDGIVADDKDLVAAV